MRDQKEPEGSGMFALVNRAKGADESVKTAVKLVRETNI